MPDMTCAIQGLPLASLDVDEWAELTWRLAQQVSPEDLIAGLPASRRCSLPPTSPLFYYPHVWMSGATSGASDPKVTAPDDILRLAPIWWAKGASLTGSRSLWRGALGGKIAIRIRIWLERIRAIAFVHRLIIIVALLAGGLVAVKVFMPT